MTVVLVIFVPFAASNPDTCANSCPAVKTDGEALPGYIRCGCFSSKQVNENAFNLRRHTGTRAGRESRGVTDLQYSSHD